MAKKSLEIYGGLGVFSIGFYDAKETREAAAAYERLGCQVSVQEFKNQVDVTVPQAQAEAAMPPLESADQPVASPSVGAAWSKGMSRLLHAGSRSLFVLRPVAAFRA